MSAIKLNILVVQSHFQENKFHAVGTRNCRIFLSAYKLGLDCIYLKVQSKTSVISCTLVVNNSFSPAMQDLEPVLIATFLPSPCPSTTGRQSC